jgi:hypothetical protein
MAMSARATVEGLLGGAAVGAASGVLVPAMVKSGDAKASEIGGNLRTGALRGAVVGGGASVAIQSFSTACDPGSSTGRCMVYSLMGLMAAGATAGWATTHNAAGAGVGAAAAIPAILLLGPLIFGFTDGALPQAVPQATPLRNAVAMVRQGRIGA